MLRLANVALLLALLVAVAAADEVTLTPIGVYETGIFAAGATEISAYDPATMRVFSVNGATGSVEVLDLADPTNPTLLFAIDVTPWGQAANHVAVHDGVLAAAVEADPIQDPGRVVFFETAGACAYLNDVPAGALPDMCIFTPDGTSLLVACEGEPDDTYTIDPEGAVTVVDLSAGVAGAVAQTAGFTSFNPDIAALRAAGVRIYGPGATVAQDLEPEYIAVAADGLTAWVSCQENNALAVVDVPSATVTAILPLGVKDHLLAGNGLDASDRDDAINIANWPVYGMYQPDGIVSYEVGGQAYLITANEGDTRDYGGYSEEARVSSLTLDATAFPDAANLQLAANLGRLTATTADGDTGGDGAYEALYCPGARSFSIRDVAGNLVFDSGDEFEQVLAAALPDYFNSNNDDNDSFDNRSDNKGPEPEGVDVIQIAGRWYAVIGLERIGGWFLYDVTDPTAPVFMEYATSRNFTGDPAGGTAGGLGPEGVLIIPADESPVGQTVVLVSNEVSGSIDVLLLDTVTVAIEQPDEEPAPEIAPTVTRLVGAFPNPFNPTTSLKFDLSRNQYVTLAVVDVLGRRVETLVDGVQAAGEHSVSWFAEGQPSGVYLAVLSTDERVQVKQITLVK